MQAACARGSGALAARDADGFGRGAQDFNYTAAIEDVIGSNAAYYTYAGSFTTPPCTEAVTWIVLKDPIRMTSVDLVNLKNAEGVNNRPVLPLNERTVYYKA